MKEINKYKYISFDIFDTLIKRNVEKPEDIFKIVEKKLQIENFYEKRIDAQKKAYLKKKKSEVTLDEIYENIDLDKKIIENAKDCERQTEIEFCQYNLKIDKTYNEIRDKSKIILITDMYLDRDTISKILNKCSIKYSKLYISSELNLTKSKGNIFKYILKDLKMNGKDLIHLGDNFKSDFLNPRKYGICSIHIKDSTTRHFFNKNNQNIEYNILKSFIKNNQKCSDNYFFKCGYECLGPLLYGFSKWLLKEIEAENINRLFFLSRDGKIIKEAFDLIKQNSVESIYFFGSRRSTIVPSLWKYNTLEKMISIMHVGRRITIKNLFKKLGIETLDRELIINKYDIDIYKEYMVSNILTDKKINKMFIDYVDEIKKNSKNEYDFLLEYYQKQNFKGKVAIIDIGWNGNMQNAIQNMISDVDLNGYYIGLKPNNIYQDRQKMKGYLFDKYSGYELFEKEEYFPLVFEFLFMTQHGSVKKFVDFSKNNCYVELEKYEYEDRPEKFILKDIQNGAIQFIKDFISSNLNNCVFEIINKDISYLNLYELGLNPSLKDSKKIGNIMFVDNDLKYIAKPKILLCYILNIKKFIVDYKSSSWRIGFLKRILKIKSNYYVINKKIRKIFLK